MSRPCRSIEVGALNQTIRSGWNYWSGLILALGAPLACLFLDPLAVLPQTDERLDSALQLTLLLASFSLAAVRFFVSPRLDSHANGIVIVNAFKVISLNIGAIEEVDDSGFWMRVRAGGRWFVASGTESSAARGLSPRLASQVAALKLRCMDSGDANAGMDFAEAWRGPVRLEVLLLCFWVTYVFLGA